jgi:hypothetical protein
MKTNTKFIVALCSGFALFIGVSLCADLGYVTRFPATLHAMVGVALALSIVGFIGMIWTFDAD